MTNEMTMADALYLIEKSIYLGKYDNARGVLEDIIKSHLKNQQVEQDRQG